MQTLSEHSFIMPTSSGILRTSGPVSGTKLTYRDYVLFPADGHRHEIIDGRHYMNAAPNPRHQAVSRHIQFQLYEAIERKGLGEVINAPVDVQFFDCDVVQPDLVVVLKGNGIVSKTRIVGVPDLVIEILSPPTRELDLRLKKQLYDQSGVPEYWIVAPQKCSVHQYRLNSSGRYGRARVCTSTVTFHGLPQGIRVNLTEVW
jgi:Uma2 family endonuclease